MERSHVCTFICLPPKYMDAYALVSAPGPAYGGSLFWGMQRLLGGLKCRGAVWYLAAPSLWELRVHQNLCQAGLSPGAEKYPKS